MNRNKPVDKIYVRLENTAHAYSEYSTDENPSLNTEFAEHLADLSNDKSVGNPIEINIKLDTPVSMEEKQHLISTIHTHFKHKLNDINNQKNRIWLITGVLLFLGIASLLLYHFLVPHVNSFLTEMLLEIGTWVFVWEFFYALFFELPSVNFKAHQTKRIINANIKFLENQIN